MNLDQLTFKILVYNILNWRVNLNGHFIVCSGFKGIFKYEVENGKEEFLKDICF
jgi:hypothetical protein